MFYSIQQNKPQISTPATPINVTSTHKIDADFNEESDAGHEQIALEFKQPTKISRDKRTELHHQYFPHFCLPDKDCGQVGKELSKCAGNWTA